MNATSPATDNRRTLAFDIFNGAVGFLDACYVAQQMITAGEYATAMIMAAETDNNATSSHESVGYAETASAFILDAPSLNEEGFSRFHFKYDLESIDAYATHYKVEDVGSYLHIKKESNLEELYLGCIATAVKELLQLEELEPCSIDIIFPPQISHEFITRLSEKLDLSRESFVDAVGDGTDLFSSSLPYAFRLAREKQLVKPGNTGLIINVGSGIQVGCAIYHF